MMPATFGIYNVTEIRSMRIPLRHFFIILAWCVLIPLLAGCFPATDNAQQKDPFFDEWRAKANTSLPIGPESRKTTATSQDAGNTVAPAVTLETEQKVTVGVNKEDLPSQKISITFVDTPLGTVLRSLGRMAGQNILINPSISGMVNTHIVDTPWNDVFLGIVSSYGLIVTREDNLLRVMSVDDLKVQVERQTLLLEQGQVSPLVTEIVPIEFSNPTEIVESVKLLLSKNKEGNPRGSVSVDVHSRSLIIRDAADNIAALVDQVQQLDRPTPQILIEAHIVETSKDTARELGAQWGWMMVDQVSDGHYAGITPGGINGKINEETGKTEYTPGVDGKNRGGIKGQGFGIDLPAAAIGSINPASLGLIHFNSNSNLLEVQLSALQKAGKANILSRPSIATLDNIEANIESGADVPFQTVDENKQISVQYKEAVLRLKVTPHVISDHLIKLDIEAKKDEVDTSRTVLGNPFIIKKLAQTKLIVENGSTVVIAGLSKERNSKSTAGVPWLKDLPLLGFLFRTDSRSNDFEELLIFITPKILTSSLRDEPLAASTPVERP